MTNPSNLRPTQMTSRIVKTPETSPSISHIERALLLRFSVNSVWSVHSMFDLVSIIDIYCHRDSLIEVALAPIAHIDVNRSVAWIEVKLIEIHQPNFSHFFLFGFSSIAFVHLYVFYYKNASNFAVITHHNFKSLHSNELLDLYEDFQWRYEITSNFRTKRTRNQKKKNEHTKCGQGFNKNAFLTEGLREWYINVDPWVSNEHLNAFKSVQLSMCHCVWLKAFAENKSIHRMVFHVTLFVWDQLSKHSMSTIR